MPFHITFSSYSKNAKQRWAVMHPSTFARAKAEAVAARILARLKDYQAVEAETGVPWHFIACVHYRESDLNFKTHLHNGDPLTHRTVHVPRNRPLGHPPFTWTESAIDALKYEGLDKIKDWSDFGRYAYQMEAYNGWGYARRGRPSPYLWSGSDQYHEGKFTGDGRYVASAVDEQLGTMLVLRALASHPDCPDITFLETAAPSASAGWMQSASNFLNRFRLD